MTPHLEPTMDAGRALFLRNPQGPLVMPNLLRFRETADYAAHPDLAPPTPITGAEAFDCCIAHTLPFLTDSGGALLFLVKGGPFPIGPEAERWDLAMLVRQSSLQAFMAFNENPAYLAGLGHRSAALEESRLLPLTPQPLPGPVQAAA